MSIFKEIEKLKSIEPGDTIYVKSLSSCFSILNIYKDMNGSGKMYHIRKGGDDYFISDVECRKIIDSKYLKAFSEIIKEHSMFNGKDPRDRVAPHELDVGDKVNIRNNHLSNKCSHIIYRTYSKNGVYFYDLIDALGRRVIAIREDNIYKI